MIKGINSSGRYITVSGGQSSTPYISPGSVGAGMLRYNTNTNNIEVSDGNGWQILQMNHATIELNSDTEALIEWARLERTKQRMREERIQKNPALQKAYEAVKRAESNFEMLESIAGTYENQDDN
jgi:hypothetical protein